jgi:hypothetical protein
VLRSDPTTQQCHLKAESVAVYRSVRVKGDTKTRKSRRVLKLPTRAVQALRAHHTRQAVERLPAGELWQEHGLVFCREDGTPLDRWHVRKEFQKITRAARLGGAWGPHDTHAAGQSDGPQSWPIKRVTTAAPSMLCCLASDAQPDRDLGPRVPGLPESDDSLADCLVQLGGHPGHVGQGVNITGMATRRA